MTRAEFDKNCRDICIHCKNGVALRQRTDTLEWVHDGALEIPGTLGRRWSHTICHAHDFRTEWQGKIDG